ncbi:MAG TPA: M28 family peptidase [Terriglobia bacterium]|nr:M28 family peptidase [Terriglobia bacterium]
MRVRLSTRTPRAGGRRGPCIAAFAALLWTLAGWGRPPREAGAGRNPQESKGQPAAARLASFDGARAFRDLKALVAFGPRPAGSDALAHSRNYIERELAASGLKVEEDKFTATTPVGSLDMANLMVRIPGTSPDIVVVAGHYDTKRFDKFRFVGANDGASSAALVLELGRVLAGKRLPYTLWLVWFDGEEAQLQQWQGTDNDYGSRHLVQSLSAEGRLDRVKALILVDMIGDAKLDVRRDTGSTPWLTDVEFSAARRLGYGSYFLNQDITVGGDDYDPWLAAGVPSVDLIDFNYGPNARSRPGDPDWNIYWHTAQDTVEHCSAQSLEVVGRVVLGMLQDLENSPHVRP